MPVAEFVELRGLTRCLGSECVVYRLPTDEQEIEARARSFGLWKEATLREQFLHFEGVVCGLPRQSAGHPDVEDPHTLIAFKLNGKDLPLANGAPVRLVVPGWPNKIVTLLTRLFPRGLVLYLTSRHNRRGNR